MFGERRADNVSILAAGMVALAVFVLAFGIWLASSVAVWVGIIMMLVGAIIFFHREVMDFPSRRSDDTPSTYPHRQ